MGDIQVYNIEKTKAVDPHIVVHGTSDKPYYAITYYDVSDKQWYRGSYGSKNLDYVFEQLNTHFEVVTTKDEIIEACEALTNGGYVTIHDNTNNLVTIKI